MAEYIKREEVYQYLDNEVEWNVNQDRLYTLEVISDFPAADVVEVRHGRWIKYKYFDECSECYAMAILRHNYCPNCGARMDTKEENNLGSAL